MPFVQPSRLNAPTLRRCTTNKTRTRLSRHIHFVSQYARTAANQLTWSIPSGARPAALSHACKASDFTAHTRAR